MDTGKDVSRMLGVEVFFRKIRGSIRKRSGITATGKILSQSGDSLMLFQNMSNPGYRKIVFGSGDISAVFCKAQETLLERGDGKEEGY